MQEHDKMLEKLENQMVPQGDNLSVQSISREIARLAWLAGIMEGEGSFGMYIIKAHNDRFRVNHNRSEVQVRTCISIVNSDIRMIHKISTILFDYDLKFNFTLRNKKPRNMLELHLTGKKNCKKFINLIKPYLYSKLDQAQLMLDLIDYRENRKEGQKSYDILKDIRLLQGIESLKKLKSNLVDPSTTTRRASQPLGMKI